MKISDINQQTNIMQYVNQANSSNSQDKPRASEEAKDKSSSDKVELSAQSREMQKIFDVLQMTPDVRAEKVSALKKLIEEDQYQVDSEAVADKMIKESLLELVK